MKALDLGLLARIISAKFYGRWYYRQPTPYLIPLQIFSTE